LYYCVVRYCGSDFYLTGLVLTLFQAKAFISGSQKYSGHRRVIYTTAQTCCAVYDVENQDQSIWYPPSSEDLCISLMFKSEEHAITFLGQMSLYKEGGKFRDNVNFEEEPTVRQFPIDTQVKHVYTIHYNPDDSASPANSRDDSICSSEVTNAGDPVKQLRSLEDLSKIAYKETIYRCHIAAKAHYGEYEHCPDNLLFESHLYHGYFDGDGKKPPPGSAPSWGRPPELRLECVSVGDVRYFQGTQFQQVRVKVTFRDPAVARAMDPWWRDGSSFVDELSMLTHFYTVDVEAAKLFLKIKHFETSRRWSHCDGDYVDFTQSMPGDYAYNYGV
jgi:hypothetical protein